MAQLSAWLAQHLEWAFGGVIGGVVLMMTIGGVARRLRGQPILRPRLADALFTETWASGGSSLGWASNCLWVAVTDRRLHLGMHFPFNLMLPRFLARWVVLEATIPLEKIASTEKRASLFSGNTITLSFRNDGGAEKRVELKLRKADGFLSRLADARSRFV